MLFVLTTSLGPGPATEGLVGGLVCGRPGPVCGHDGLSLLLPLCRLSTLGWGFSVHTTPPLVLPPIHSTGLHLVPTLGGGSGHATVGTCVSSDDGYRTQGCQGCQGFLWRDVRETYVSSEVSCVRDT